MTNETYSGGFHIRTREARCADLVAAIPSLVERTVVIAQPLDHALILGSMQHISGEQQQRCEEAGFDVVTRRSGGGAVVVDPGCIFWVDLFIPAGDPLFMRDVRKSSFWVGDLWIDSLHLLGIDAAAMLAHRGPVIASRWSKQCCFLGLGPGEVQIGVQKVIGLSQRRSREGAWFFTLAYQRVDAERDAMLLAPTLDDRDHIAEDLRANVATLSVTHDQMRTAFLSALENMDSQQ
jgi:lipoate-protein ligase A